MLTKAGVSAMTNVNWTPGEDAPAMAGGAVILMAQTVGRRNPSRQVWNRYNAADLLVIDEAHHAAADGWTRAMQQWPGPIVGMTATPWRLSEKKGSTTCLKIYFVARRPPTCRPLIHCARRKC